MIQAENNGPGAVKIIDFHCHIASEDIIPRSFVDGTVENVYAALSAQGLPVTPERIASMYHRKLADPLCDELVAEMDAAGIAKSVLLAADFSYVLDDCALNVEEALDRHRQVLLRHPGRFEAFAGVDPRWGKDGIDLFERSITELGFRGFKVYPPCGFSPSDPMLFPFYELCAHYRVPVLLHIGPTSPVLSFDTADPFLIDEAARRFPTVDFVLAHGSVSFVEQCLMMCQFRPNVFLDVSGYQSVPSRDGINEALLRVTSQGVNHKVLFGTDWPVHRILGSQESVVAPLLAEDGTLADCTETEFELILHGNAERLLGKSSVLR